MPNVPLSILDLAPIREGGTPAQALRETLELARLADRLGFHRYWLAEHHNIRGVASSATAVLMGQVAAATARIRVGSGGIMLPNHAPFTIAEQFGTLEALHPGRIDLGVGRAPGSDLMTSYALRRNQKGSQGFPQELAELREFLAPARPDQPVVARPGAGADVPIFVLGSSDVGARLAAAEGLGYAFAAHFSPRMMLDALRLYREGFTPAAPDAAGGLSAPYAILGTYVLVADTDEEAERLFTSTKQKHTAFIRSRPAPLPPPRELDATYWSPLERNTINGQLREAVVGSPSTVLRGLQELLDRTGADELIVASEAFDPVARRRSYELLAELAGDLSSTRQLVSAQRG
ncbi:MAG TPA: LLM class flavin-dependent oxidoreductase [Solirubrobacteraceae bacterium]|nr:LLM class flavin-dependent oxidoreductase [Solirubrobacteraceae bacterium]